MSTQAPLQTKQLAIGYGSKKEPCALAEGLDLTLNTGQLVCLLGPNGSGKTTLIRTLAALHKPLAGELLWQDQPAQAFSPRERAKKVGIVLTHLENTGNMCVEELVMLGRHPYTGWFGQISDEDIAQVGAALEQTNTAHLRGRIFQTLSDGERQRVLIARALSQQTSLVLLDEPTAFLDLPGRAKMMRLLSDMAHERSIAVLLSTHDLSLAMDVADRFWLIEDDGSFHQGAPEDLILDGTLERVFAKDGIVLDRASGQLRLRPRERAEAVLHGQGERFLWTRHALERNGFTIIDPAQASNELWQVRVGESEWTAQKGEHKVTVKTIAALMEQLLRV